MIISILTLFLKVLPGPIFDWLKSKNVVEQYKIEAEVKRRKYQADILLKESEHWIAWLPRFIIALFVALYTAQVLITSMFHIPAYGPLKLPPDFIWVLMNVISGLFLLQAVKVFKR